MAISKILHMKDCGSSFHGKHLKSALEYITVCKCQYMNVQKVENKNVHFIR